MKDKLAGIEYRGTNGISQECINAVVQLVQFGVEISRVRILTCSNKHALLLTVEPTSRLVAIKSGFSSGYNGEGPRAFSFVLAILDARQIPISEYAVSRKIMQQIDDSALTVGDIAQLDKTEEIWPSRWRDFVLYEHLFKNLLEKFPLFVPYAIIDRRIMDLAIDFWDRTDDKIFNAYKRLEDIVRKRTAIEQHGVKLFAEAFQGAKAKLVWKSLDSGEQEGRSLLFTGTFKAYRNRRAHRVVEIDRVQQLSEFLLINQLYLLESEAVNSYEE